jgi:hypothetical protein
MASVTTNEKWMEVVSACEKKWNTTDPCNIYVSNVVKELGLDRRLTVAGLSADAITRLIVRQRSSNSTETIAPGPSAHIRAMALAGAGHFVIAAMSSAELVERNLKRLLRRTGKSLSDIAKVPDELWNLSKDLSSDFYRDVVKESMHSSAGHSHLLTNHSHFSSTRRPLWTDLSKDWNRFSERVSADFKNLEEHGHVAVVVKGSDSKGMPLAYWTVLRATGKRNASLIADPPSKSPWKGGSFKFASKNKIHYLAVLRDESYSNEFNV